MGLTGQAPGPTQPTMSLYAACVPQMSKMLKNLVAWLDEAEAYAEERGFDAERLTVARLYPDQFELTRQIQSACDTAKFAASRLSGGEAPKFEDDEKTLPELRERIAKTLAYLESVPEDSFEGAAERELTLSFLQGRAIKAGDYFTEFAQPNFYFHVVSAYSVLRNNGVQLGKRKYIGSMTAYEP